MPPDGVSERFQQGGRFAHPVGQRRAVNVEPVAAEDLALAVEWQMISVFVDQNMGEQTRSRPATLDRAAWQRCLREAIAAGTGHPGPHDAVHDEVAGDVFQLFGHILAQAAQLASALGALCAAGCQLDLDAGNMVRDRFALRLVGGGIIGQAQLCSQSGNGDLTHLQRQLQLLGCLG